MSTTVRHTTPVKPSTTQAASSSEDRSVLVTAESATAETPAQRVADAVVNAPRPADPIDAIDPNDDTNSDLAADGEPPMELLPGWKNPSTLSALRLLRRTIHKYPEPGWTEFLSTARMAEVFEGLGFSLIWGPQFIHPEFVRGRDAKAAQEGKKFARLSGVPEPLMAKMGDYPGLVAEIDTGVPGKTVAIRVELDALAVEEPVTREHLPARESFISVRHGIMHACGHDGHQAVAIELARFVKANLSRLSGKIRFILQPAEEGSRGAYPIVKSGVLDDVDVLLCAHLGVDIPAGTVVAAPEKFLSTTKLDLEFRGSPSHAGMQPQLGRNALLAAANAAINVMALPRHAEGMTRVNVGSLHAGEGRNVVPSHATMEVEVRGENEAINRELAAEALLRARGAAISFGVEMLSRTVGEAIDFVPDESITQLIAVCARRARFCEKVVPTHPYNGSDDGTLMIRCVQEHGGRAGYFMVGAALNDCHAHAAVDFEERNLLTLYDTYANLLVALVGNWT